MSAPPIPDVCPELGLEVPVASIDQALRRLWDQDEARTNASLMNLVVYSEKSTALLENSAIIRNLTREHACRAILVEINRAESSRKNFAGKSLPPPSRRSRKSMPFRECKGESSGYTFQSSQPSVPSSIEAVRRTNDGTITGNPFNVRCTSS